MSTNAIPDSLREQILQVAVLAEGLAGFIHANLPVVGEPWQGEAMYRAGPAIGKEMVEKSVVLKQHCNLLVSSVRPGEVCGAFMGLAVCTGRVMDHYLGAHTKPGEVRPDPPPIPRRLVWDLRRAARELQRAAEPAGRNTLLEAHDEWPWAGSQESARLVAEELTNPPKPPVPVWVSKDRELYWQDRLIRRYKKHPAWSQIELLNAFQEEAWTRTIANPLETAARLNQTIRHLNASLPDGTIKILGDGSCKVRWEPVEN